MDSEPGPDIWPPVISRGRDAGLGDYHTIVRNPVGRTAVRLMMGSVDSDRKPGSTSFHSSGTCSFVVRDLHEVRGLILASEWTNVIVRSREPTSASRRRLVTSSFGSLKPDR